MSAAIRFDEAKAWLTDKALPLWTSAGLDHVCGGAVEALDFSGLDAGLAYKRVRTQARQVYAFTHAGIMGWSGEGFAAADQVWSFLTAHARRDDGGWVRRLTRDGEVLDPVADAYDMAFILYALAWRARGGDETALAQANEVMDAYERLLRPASDPGFLPDETRTDVRLQNPHMHLLEACLELADAGAGDRFVSLGREVVGIFTRSMYEPDAGFFVETYDARWRPRYGEGQAIEPGHLYEWTWLLHRAEAWSETPLGPYARALTAFAERRGLDPVTGLAEDGLDGAEMTPRRTFRLWPLTEALKAHLALFEHQGMDTRRRIADLVTLLLDHHLSDAPAGGWMDQYGPGFAPIAANVPASILYHLQLAFAELLRLRPKLEAVPSSNGIG